MGESQQVVQSSLPSKKGGSVQPRIVLVTRPTEHELLLARHATQQQADFFLRQRAQKVDDVVVRHQRFEAVRQGVLAAIPVEWRRSRVPRADLDRFLFEPGDIVVAVGQDGLVANVAKYLAGQPVVGINPDPERYEGVLVPHPPAAAPDLIRAAVAGRARCEERTMVEATLEDGQRLVALNEVFVGHRTHQSARYTLRVGQAAERQSSSGLIVATGTGATGWTRSILRERRCELQPPAPTDPRLAYLVREAWPSVATGTTVTEGLLGPAESLVVTSEMDDDGVVFGDGIETDRLEFGFGRIVTVRVSATTLNLVR